MSLALRNRYTAFYEKWGPFILLVQGTIVVVISILIAVIGLTVLHEQEEERAKKSKEHATLVQTCERAKVFGPPFLLHVERVEKRLKTGALEGEVEWPVGGGKHEPVLKFYRSTIPSSCPK